MGANEPNGTLASYWAVPMPTPGTLCDPVRLSELIGGGTIALGGVEAAARARGEGTTPVTCRITFCVRCDRPIEGAAVKVAGESQLGAASGAREDDWRHVEGDPACRPRR
ncbi:hypothetical protein [Streptomyces sp. NPDC048361]|uniref:hypothetical protein n=1 Tax=Streptomyces sp. NPDC048361 TaxID=3154720 RepID=UPI0034222251